MLAVNRLSAEAWFEDGEWPVWRRRLQHADVPLSPLSFGDCHTGACWRPYVGGVERPVHVPEVKRSLGTALGHAPATGAAICAFETVFDAAPRAAVRSASEVLADSGLELKSIHYDDAGRVVGVDPLPVVPATLVEPVAARIAAAIDDHLHCG